jgi:hypothetical protein
MGCSVTAVAGSVENKQDIASAIASSRKPLKGVFQLAMILSVSTLKTSPDGDLTNTTSGRPSSGDDLVTMEHNDGP